MYQCFNCGQDTVCWDSDFSFDDFGLEGDGIVHVMHCANCGAYITYEVPIDEVATSHVNSKMMPTRKKGVWYTIDECMTICSECHSLGCGTPYCPTCGAEMEVSDG